MLNTMCLNCKLLGNDCSGTSEKVWTGCIYRQKNEDDKKEVKKPSTK